MCLFSLVMGSGIKSQVFSPLGFRVLVTKIHIGCWGFGTIFLDRVGFPPPGFGYTLLFLIQMAASKIAVCQIYLLILCNRIRLKKYTTSNCTFNLYHIVSRYIPFSKSMSLKILVGCLQKLFFRLTLNIGGGGETDLKTFKMELVVLFWVFFICFYHYYLGTSKKLQFVS